LTAEEATAFIHDKAWQGSKPGLSRTRALLEKMGRPQDRLEFVHVAGTNGKGSTCAMLASVLMCAGYKTGLYTSPGLRSFNEKIAVNGVPISSTELARVTAFCAPFARAMADAPTEFELVTAIAIEYFARQGCQAVVLETGMGGTLDSTNVIEKPLCAVITNISLDHTRELGATVEKIATEKAGIIKYGCPTVTYSLPENILAVISSRCLERASPLSSADFGAIETISDGLDGQRFSYKGFKDLFLPLLGSHQLRNAAVVLEAISVLRSRGLAIDDGAVRSGLENTRWPARFEIVSEKPFFVVDGGHNPQCAEAVAENLIRYFPEKRRVILLGILADKDYLGFALSLDPAACAYVTVAPRNPRALSASALAEALRSLGKPVEAAESIESGIEQARALAGEDGVVCSVGSLYTADTVMTYFGK